MVWEILHSAWRKRGRKGLMVVKLDIKKAYDRISWPLLAFVLQKVGFNHEISHLIMFCVSSPSLSVIWNGEVLEIFKPSRELRQEIPCLLIYLCFAWKVWNIWLKNLRMRGTEKGLDRDEVLQLYPIFFFADDLLLFSNEDPQQARNIQDIIAHFCSILGQRVNMAKCKLFVSPNMEASVE